MGVFELAVPRPVTTIGELGQSIYDIESSRYR